MRRCTVTRGLEIVEGGIEDYNCLCGFHYRGSLPSVVTSIYAIRPGIGVIVYTMPTAGCQLRNVATGNIFAGFDRSTRLKLINYNIRCISRVIIEPRYRGLGLAARLVRETLERVDVPIVEALAVMGNINPFFEKASMKGYKSSALQRSVRLEAAFSEVGIEGDDLIDADIVMGKIESLAAGRRQFIESEISKFLCSYGRRWRDMSKDQNGIERIRFVLSKLTLRPMYYIWFNEKLELRFQ